MGDIDTAATAAICIMNARDYGYSANINIEKIKNDFMKYDNIGHRERMVLSILEMIKAYDKTNRIELLQMAFELCKWLEKREKDNSVHIMD